MVVPVRDREDVTDAVRVTDESLAEMRGLGVKSLPDAGRARARPPELDR